MSIDVSPVKYSDSDSGSHEVLLSRHRMLSSGSHEVPSSCHRMLDTISH